MPHLEPVQIAALAFALVVGFVLGFIGNTSGGRWRKRYQKDRDFYADYREKSEKLIAEKSHRIADLEGQLAHATAPVVAPVQEVEAPVAEVAAPPAEPAPVAEAEPVPAPTHDSCDVAPIVAAPLALVAEDAMAEAHAEPMVNVEPHGDVVVEQPADSAAEPATAVTDDNIVDAHFEPVAESATHEPVDADSTGAELTRIRGIDAALAARLAEVGVRTPQDIEKLSAEDEMALEKRLDLSTGQIALEQWRLQAALIGSGEEPDHPVSGDPDHHADATADPHDTVEHAPHHPMAVASEGAAAV